jgi:very-short-patch-repair endonuclease
MDVLAVVGLVQEAGGVARRADFPRRAVQRALEAGLLVAPRKGLVADARLPAPVLLALRLGGVLSCASAAAYLGLELLEEPVRVHVTVPRGSVFPKTWDAVVHERDVEAVAGVTSLARTAADCARCLPEREAVVVVDGVLRRGISTDEILQHLWGRGCGRARAAVRRGDGRADSGGETVVRLALEDAGLQVQPQVAIRGVGRVDLLVEGRVVVEVDGFAYHGGPQAFANDRRRDVALTGMGYVVLRFTWLDAVRRTDRVVAAVAQVVSRLG